MRLILGNINYEMELSLQPNVLIIENPHIFSEIVLSFMEQSCGRDGVLLLSDKEKSVKFDKKVDYINNPFAVNCNDRKILNKIYQDIIIWANENQIEKLTQLNASFVTLLEKLSLSQPFPLSYNLEMDIPSLLKSYNLRVDDECSDRLEYLISYIKLSHRVIGTSLFVFLNLKQYFDEKQLLSLYETIIYEQVYVLDIEGFDINRHIPIEECTIIDNDLCIIELN